MIPLIIHTPSSTLRNLGRSFLGAAKAGLGAAAQIAAPIAGQAFERFLRGQLGVPAAVSARPVVVAAPPLVAAPIPTVRRLPGTTAADLRLGLPAVAPAVFPSPPVTGVPMPAFPVSRAAFGVGTEGFGLGAEIRERLGGAFGGQQTFFAAGMPTARPLSEISQVNPVTGRTHVWKHMGRPVLYSGDLATCKRVKKIAARASRSTRSRKR